MSTYDEWLSTQPDPWADEEYGCEVSTLVARYIAPFAKPKQRHPEYHGLITVVEGEGEGWIGAFDQFVDDNQEYANLIGEALATKGEFSDAEQWGRWTIKAIGPCEYCGAPNDENHVVCADDGICSTSEGRVR